MAYIFSAMRPQNLPQKHQEIQNGDRARQRFVARDSPAGHAAIPAVVPTQACFRFFFSIFSPVFQQLLFIFPDLNFLLSTIYFSREILLTNTLEKNLIQIISSIVLRICMMKLYSYNL